MQQMFSCPGCGANVVEGQQFCGLCGAKLSDVALKSESICPGCGANVVEGQQFCGICGTRLDEVSKQPPDKKPSQDIAATGIASGYEKQFTTPVAEPAQPVVSETLQHTERTPFAAGTQSTGEPVVVTGSTTESSMYAPVTEQIAPRRRAVSRRTYSILKVAAIIFQIFGWIILVGGILVSIGMAIFAGIGGKFISVVPELFSLEGVMAIGVAIGGIVASLLYGFGFLAFAELCYAVIDIIHHTSDRY